MKQYNHNYHLYFIKCHVTNNNDKYDKIIQMIIASEFDSRLIYKFCSPQCRFGT